MKERGDSIITSRRGGRWVYTFFWIRNKTSLKKENNLRVYLEFSQKTSKS